MFAALLTLLNISRELLVNKINVMLFVKHSIYLQHAVFATVSYFVTKPTAISCKVVDMLAAYYEIDVQLF